MYLQGVLESDTLVDTYLHGVLEREVAVHGHGTHVPDRGRAHHHVHRCPHDTHGRVKREVTYKMAVSRHVLGTTGQDRVSYIVNICIIISLIWNNMAVSRHVQSTTFVIASRVSYNMAT